MTHNKIQSSLCQYEDDYDDESCGGGSGGGGGGIAKVLESQNKYNK
jgi:hypothetical protein